MIASTKGYIAFHSSEMVFSLVFLVETVLHPCLNSCDILQFVSCTSRSSETSSTDIPAKKRKLSTEVDPENAESEEKNGVNSVLEASGME